MGEDDVKGTVSCRTGIPERGTLEESMKPKDVLVIKRNYKGPERGIHRISSGADSLAEDRRHTGRRAGGHTWNTRGYATDSNCSEAVNI